MAVSFVRGTQNNISEGSRDPYESALIIRSIDDVGDDRLNNLTAGLCQETTEDMWLHEYNKYIISRIV